MAEATRLKDVQTDLKRLLDLIEQHRIADGERMDRLEATVGALQINIASQANIHKDQIPLVTPFQCNPFQSWAVFRHALESEFGPSPYDSPRATLFKLTQSTTVNNYYVEFTSLANRTRGLTADALLDCFLSGLKDEVRRDVLAQNPTSLAKAVSLAKLFDEKYHLPLKPYVPSSIPKATPSQGQSVFGNSTPVFGAATTSPNNNDQMSMEDSMAEDSMQSPTPISQFGQAPAAAPGFMFGSAAPTPTPTPAALSFQFGGQPNQAPAQNPFQSSSIEFNAGGGSFFLGSGGDKSGRRILRVKSKNRRK